MDYIVYTKVTCSRCDGRGFHKFSHTDIMNCALCNGNGTELKEIDLEEAIRDVIRRNPYIINALLQ